MPDRVDPTLIRLQCDCEMSPEQAAALEHYLQVNPLQRDVVDQQLAFERTLKAHVSAVMQDCRCCPPELVERIKCVCLPEVAGRIGPNTSNIESAPAARRRSFFANTTRANFFAIAATLAVIGGAVLFGIFGRTIDDMGQRVTGDLISDAATFIDHEHTVTARSVKSSPEHATQDMLTEVGVALSQWLGTPVTVFDLHPAGYEFVSATHSGMPVPAKSAHLIYRKIVEPGQRAPLLSVFIVRDSNRCGEKLCGGVDKGKWCCLSETGVKCKRRILRATDGQLVYFLVCCNESDLDPVTSRIQLASNGGAAP